jgi:hypothetical protein
MPLADNHNIKGNDLDGIHNHGHPDYEKRACTGAANSGRPGLFELSDGGALF